MNTRRSSSRGFTLVEALAAIVVMAIIIPVILEGFNIASNIAGLARQTADATMLAQSTMDELISDGSWQTSSGPGEQMVGPTTYDVTVEVNSWDGEVDVWELIVRVGWTHRGHREITLTTVVYQPETTIQGSGAPGSTASISSGRLP